MSRRYSEALVKAVAVTAELCGTTLSPEAARVMVDDLAGYPEGQVLSALARCRREVKGRLTIAEVLSRIDDGRPGPEEAWAMLPRDERDSAVMTQEMAQAFGVAAPLLDDDHVAARVAFRETYVRLVQAARDNREPARWFPSLGWDQQRRIPVLAEAARLGRITLDHAASLVHLEHRDALLQLASNAKPDPRETPQLREARDQVRRLVDSAVKRDPA